MKKRQKIRNALIIISFFFFPITIYYLSPVLIIMGGAEGIITGSFIMFSLLFLSALLLGRAFCGWVCPAAGLQEICFLARNKNAKTGKSDWIKYFIWVPWMGGIIFAFIKAGGFSKVDPYYQTVHGISISEPAGYIVYYFFVGLITILALTAGKRAFCHYVCWMAPFMVIGTKIRNVFKWPALHLIADEEKCVDCKRCTRNCPMSLKVHKMALKGSMENSECILCGSCVDICPEDAITYSFRSGN